MAVTLFTPLHLEATSFSSLNFSLSNPTISEGGATSSTSAHFIEKGTIGGMRAIGKSSGTKFTVRSGFRYYDETAPLTDGVVINDGAADDIDEQTSLNSLSANWFGFSDPESGLELLLPYEYAIFRQTDGKYWNSDSSLWQTAEFWKETALTLVTALPVYLATGETYFFKIRARNNSRLVSRPVLSDGISVISNLAFSLDSGTVNLGNLDASNNFTSENAGTTLTVNTNAYYGYTIKVWSTQPLTHTELPQAAIADFAGTNESPLPWDFKCFENNSYCAFGYTTNDGNLSGGASDRFVAAGPKYARFSHSGLGDPAADHTEFITGQNGEVSFEQWKINYKVSTDDASLTGNYATTIIFIIIPNF